MIAALREGFCIKGTNQLEGSEERKAKENKSQRRKYEATSV